VYHSAKRADHDTWEHAIITLKPDSTLPGFSNLVFEGEPEHELTIRGELVAVLGQRSGDLWESDVQMSSRLSEQTRIVMEAKRRLSVENELEAVCPPNPQRAARLGQCVLRWGVHRRSSRIRLATKTLSKHHFEALCRVNLPTAAYVVTVRWSSGPKMLRALSLKSSLGHGWW